MQHAKAKDGQIKAASCHAILAAISEEGRSRDATAWFDRTGTALKKVAEVHEAMDQEPDSVSLFVDLVALNTICDEEPDSVVQFYALVEQEIGSTPMTLTQRTTTLHRDRVQNGQADQAGKGLSAHNDAYNELEKAVARAAVAPFNAVTRAGDLMAFNSTTAPAALSAVDAFRDKCVDREAALYDLVDAAARISELRSIDIQSGWPG